MDLPEQLFGRKGRLRGTYYFLGGENNEPFDEYYLDFAIVTSVSREIG